MASLVANRDKNWQLPFKRWHVLLGLACIVAVFQLLVLSRWRVHEDKEPVGKQPSTAFCSKLPPTICAHGGDTSTGLPPNTAAAFQQAIALGSGCVEIDVARTSDNVLIVLHPRDLETLLGEAWHPDLQVGDLSWHDISRLAWAAPQEKHRADRAAKSNDYRVLTAAEAVQMTSPFMDIILDAKTSDRNPSDEQEMADALVHLVYNTRCNNCLIWAKSDKVVDLIKDLSPAQRTGYILMNNSEAAISQGMHLPLRGVQGEVVGAHHGMIDSVLLGLLHQHNKQLYAWTINEDQVLERLLDIGVDALVTNKPGAALTKIQSLLILCGRSGALGGYLAHDETL
ncbi:PLC-like phosphodiesterase [Dunaliella salina]|uniref:glycerophosphodiester phosphodiesterase n=1 Tax=Dunaliella salina TaxID=3046 RepID=A0ABQ7H2U5_DUNSA|nr:PLC-like phosphodiesterase [Dunaliella salina]|eukprot:KAF5841138.1 PLC-like phosphodiesterase [Dunaliella salina]